MSETYRLGWRDWADGVSEAIKHALYALNHTRVDAKDPLKHAIEYTVSMAHATKRETVGDRTYGLIAQIIWNIDAALAIQMTLDDGYRDIAPDVDDRHAMTSVVPALLRHALALLDEYASAMDRHDKECSR